MISRTTLSDQIRCQELIPSVLRTRERGEGVRTIKIGEKRSPTPIPRGRLR